MYMTEQAIARVQRSANIDVDVKEAAVTAMAFSANSTITFDSA
jgi:hypothetical protein